MKVKLLSCVWLFATPWTVAHQAPLPMGFSRAEYWSGLPCPSLGDFPNPEFKPSSPALQADALTSEPPGNQHLLKAFRVKSDREKQILHINASMWNLGKWCRWTYLQGRKRDTDVESRVADTKVGKERAGQTERVVLTYIHHHVWGCCVAHGAQAGAEMT